MTGSADPISPSDVGVDVEKHCAICDGLVTKEMMSTIQSHVSATHTHECKVCICSLLKRSGAVEDCGTRNHWQKILRPGRHATRIKPSSCLKSRNAGVNLTLIWIFDLVAACRCFSKASTIASTEGSKNFATSFLYECSRVSNSHSV